MPLFETNETRVQVLKAAFEAAQPKGQLVPVTVFGHNGGTGEGELALVGYFYAASEEDMNAKLSEHFGAASSLCWKVAGFVTQKTLMKNRGNPAFEGLKDSWGYFEQFVSSSILRVIEGGGHSNFQVFIKMHVNYA